MSTFTLEKLRDNPDFAKLFAKKAVEIKQTKSNLVEAARSYQDKYQSEIETGTKKHKLMLEQGKSLGKTDEEIFKDNQLFIPTRETPILNYLFFMLRETKFEDIDIRVLRNYCDADKDIQLLREEYEQKYGAQTHAEHKNSIPNMVKFVYGNIEDDTMATLKKLKTLAQSENEAEAAVAYIKCREMCKKYRMEYDKIPINN